MPSDTQPKYDKLVATMVMLRVHHGLPEDIWDELVSDVRAAIDEAATAAFDQRRALSQPEE